ncbi:hypothetical protein ABEF92_003597 [Exophiala dermatitidis]|uniref:AAA family ATPase n=1 Tax=Exophiala dermatitidis (strain ATCC 34100 / CBS 525.76 / NIH/UT8656) TaxID=858893 RepID=H6BRA9_EXODN|nr:AAA family ATPase [Exophiala dermatitidis NIH/UT8656]EHY54690.1 AAA family ATPase [Exophiala dermatitidis NIH/UT8656]
MATTQPINQNVTGSDLLDDPTQSRPGLGIDNTVQDLMQRLKHLEAENQRLSRNSGEAPTNISQPGDIFKVLHRMGRSIYLDEPSWQSHNKSGTELRFSSFIPSTEGYLARHPEIAFLIIKDYDESELKLEHGKTTAESVQPSSQCIQFVSPEMKAAVEELISKVPSNAILFPDFTSENEMTAPYLPIYCASFMLDNILPELDPAHQFLIKALHSAIEESYGPVWTLAKEQFKRGVISPRTAPFLVQPGQVMVSTTGKAAQAYMATSWPERLPGPSSESAGEHDSPDELDDLMDLFNDSIKEDGKLKTTGHNATALEELFPASSKTSRPRDHGKHKARNENRRQTVRVCEWVVDMWCWTYQGSLQKRAGSRSFRMEFSEDTEEVRIDELGIYPLQYASAETKSLLERRGRIFWKLRNRAFVSYQEDDDMGFSNAEERYMVDTATYKRLHGDAKETAAQQSAQKKNQQTEDSGPPKGNAIYLFPPTVIGYNMRVKKWVDLFVDRISEVKWNDQAFASLVINHDSKELVEALVGSKLEAEKATDLVAGKGNGLIILLHGGPGTGKTFTAEGVAEFARKPLYRVTCGDIGTTPEAVEVYLQSVLHLGKIWDCVVLLDEADVFLEERGQAELQRNALVSVFLRCLEYYDGILILTSNRVGTFDEAFKSRIQLSLHYERLIEPQRRQIWRNFIKRLGELDRPNVNADDVLDHLDELGKHQLNGREIRNTITTARQLAQYNKQIFEYRHLQRVIEVSSRFETYLKDLREGHSDEEIKRDSGLR